MNDDIDEFHKHLKECRDCRENVFELCEIGKQLLIRAAGMLVMVEPVVDIKTLSETERDKEG